MRKTHSILGPKLRLRRCPVSGSRSPSSGGAKWKLSSYAPSKLVGNALQEIAFRVKPGDFVFVLVGHELEERAGDSLGKLDLAGEARSLDLAAHARTQLA